MLWQVVGNPNRLRFARRLDVLHGSPSFLQLLLVMTFVREERGMYEVEIHKVKLVYQRRYS